MKTSSRVRESLPAGTVIVRQRHCARCAQSISGVLCPECGAGSVETLTLEEQRLAVAGLHALMAAADEARLRTLLEQGYVPRLCSPLLDAATHTLSVLGTSRLGITDEHALGRLQRIASALRVLTGDELAQQAAHAIEQRLQALPRDRTGVGALVLLLAGMALVVCLLLAGLGKALWLLLGWMGLLGA